MSQQINLFQPAFRKEPQRFSATTLLYACGIVLVFIALLYGVGYWQLRGLQAELASAEGQHTALAARLEDVGRKFRARAKTQFLDTEIKRLEALIAAKSSIKEILERGVFANTKGYSEYLLALARQHVAGVWLTGVAIVGAGERLTLKGRTTIPELVPQYMQRLANEQMLTGIEFQIFRMARPQEQASQRSPAFVEFLATTTDKEKSDQL